MKPTLLPARHPLPHWPRTIGTSVFLIAFSFAATAGVASQVALGPSAGPVYTVYGPATLLDPLPAGVTRLGPAPGGGILVGGSVAGVESLAMRGLDLVRIDRAGELSLPARPAPSPIPPVSTAWNPAIADLVLAMSAVEVRANIQRLQDFQTRYSYSDSCAAAARYLRDRFQALGLDAALFPFAYNGYTINNVIAEKPGSERPDEIYIVCGHYDSISNQPWTNAPGADDNGSGTAAVLEAARVLAPIPFEATIRFVLFGGEEQGLIGSRRYVEQQIIPQGDDVRAVVNLDMIAFVHPNYPEWDANWYGDEPVSGILAQLVGQCVQDYTSCVWYLTLDPEPVYGSDHYWFANYGYPAVFDIDAQLWNAPDWDPYYHSIDDRLSTLDTEYGTEMARGAVAALATLAVPIAGTAVPEPNGGAIASARPLVGPNPFHTWTVFDVGAAAADVQVFDAAGRRLASIAGQGRLIWDARDADGRALPAGVYFYTVRTGDREASGRLVRIR